MIIGTEKERGIKKEKGSPKTAFLVVNNYQATKAKERKP